MRKAANLKQQFEEVLILHKFIVFGILSFKIDKTRINGKTNSWVRFVSTPS